MRNKPSEDAEWLIIQKYPQVGDNSSEVLDSQIDVDAEHIVFCIPWGHNKLIIDKCRGNKDKALLFVRQTIENNWSRAVLMNILSMDEP